MATHDGDSGTCPDIAVAETGLDGDVAAGHTLVDSLASSDHRIAGSPGPPLGQNSASDFSSARPADSTIYLQPGAELGRYEIVAKLGEGGMGIVYAAHDRDLRRTVAIKILRRSHPNVDRKDRELLLREARVMAMLADPHVVTVYDVGTIGRRDYVAMEHVDGLSLRDWVHEQRQELEPEEFRHRVLNGFIQAGRGLVAAHERGLVHGDFKPGNALVGNDGRVRVTDFGMARLAGQLDDPEDDAGDAPPLDGERIDAIDTFMATGLFAGTPAYMAPEQLSGQGQDARSDQFSFCVALHEALTGQHPFPAGNLQEQHDVTLAGHIHPSRADRSLPAGLANILVRGMNSEPDRRYPSMPALLAALEKAVAGDMTPRPTGPVSSRRRVLALIGILAVVGIAATAVIAVATRGANGPARPTEARAGGDNCDSTLALPDDPEVRARVQAIRVALAEAPALRDSDQLDRGLALTERAVANARATGYLPVEAEALYWKAVFQAVSGEASSAWKTGMEALVVAEECGHLEIRARLLIGMVALAGYFSSNLEEGKRYARRAASALAEYGNDEVLAAELDTYVGNLLALESKNREAAAHYERALAVYQRVGNLRAVDVLCELAVLGLRDGKIDEGVELVSRALALQEDALGPDNPKLNQHIGLLMLFLRARGDYDDARDRIERVLAAAGVDSAPTVADPIDDPGVLRGRVVNRDGTAVAGAEVVAGRELTADGKYLFALWDLASPVDSWPRRTVTDQRGVFAFAGLADRDYFIAAEHPDLGRSYLARPARPGGQNAATVELRSFGRLTGTFTVAGQTPPIILITAHPSASARQPDGIPTAASAIAIGTGAHFEFERLPEGEYWLAVQQFGYSVQSPNTQVSGLRLVNVIAGKKTAVDIAVPVGRVSLRITIRRADQMPVVAASVVSFPGRLVEEVYRGPIIEMYRRAIPRRASVINTQSAVAGDGIIVVPGLLPRDYTLCVTSLPFDPRDPAGQERRTLGRYLSDEFLCQPIRIELANGQVHHTVTLPQ
ncbi:MAG: protein kinase [Proteobacteria bacterium]|nr:protein kinase [Pseudomonadota bacterium]